MKWVITSRPETDVIYGLGKYNGCAFYLKKDKIRNDICEYIRQFHQDEEVISLLLEKSGDSFLYVKELVEAIKGEKLTSERLKQLPQGVNEVYRRNFDRIFMTEEEYVSGYRKILEAVVFAQAPLTVGMLLKLLQCDRYELKSKLEKLSSYLVVADFSDDDIVTVYHKSLIDWITTSNAGIYRVFEENGHILFADLFLQMVESYTRPLEYIIKHGWFHLRASKRIDTISVENVKDILVFCIKRAKDFGLLQYEKMYIEEYRKYCNDEISEMRFLLDYSVRALGSTDKKIADRLLEMSEMVEDDLTKYQIREEVAIAYFYMGRDRESLELLINERNSYTEEFWENKEILATYNHALCLSAHDLDRNKDVVMAAGISAELYKRENRYYDYYISLVNLFDAYMAIGNLKKANECAEKVFGLNEEKYYIHVEDILKICYANLLSVENRVTEALSYYEEGLSIAKDIQSWDFIYGCIWRELAIARFGDASCLKRLLEFREEARKEQYDYLVSMANCFYVLASYILNRYDEKELAEAKKQVEEFALPGHLLQTKMALVIKNWLLNDPSFEEKQIKRLLNECQGVKGYPEIVRDYAMYKNDMEVQHFFEAYISPIMEYQSEYRKKLLSHLDDEPFIASWSCVGCEAKCCYDGVYIDAKEEEKIKSFILQYPEEFQNLPQEYIVDGNWPGMEDERKTATVEYYYKDKAYPKHFTNTRCVFAAENGECMLQKVATEKLLHPWAIKPQACWAFPLRGIRKGVVISPSKKGEPDPDYVDENYPGYASFLPCAKACDRGMSWKEIFYREIEYYDYKSRKGDIP